MPSRHSTVIGGSTAERVVSCPGSVMLVESLPPSIETPSVYATEGSALHSLIAGLIEGDIVLANLRPGLTTLTVPGEGVVTLTQELMTDCVLPAWRYWEALKLNLDRPPLVEQEFAFPGVKDAFGTCDLVGRNEAQNKTYIVDWKFGAGVAVSALYPDPDDDQYEVVNAQLLFYACAARHERPALFPPGVEIVLVIVQPRAQGAPENQITQVSIGPDDLTAFEEEVRFALRNARQPNALIKLGPYCRWAPCKIVCPLFVGGLRELADILDGPPSPVSNLDDPDLDRVHLGNLLEILDKAARVEELIAEARRQARELLAAGTPVPGWKLVQKRAERKWTATEREIVARFRKLKVKKDDLYSRTLKSPRQAELTLGRQGKLPEGLAEMVSSGTTLAPAADPRPAVEMVAPEEMKSLMAMLVEPATED